MTKHVEKFQHGALSARIRRMLKIIVHHVVVVYGVVVVHGAVVIYASIAVDDVVFVLVGMKIVVPF